MTMTVLGVVRTGGSVSTVIGDMSELEVLGHLGRSYNEAIADGLSFGLPVPTPEGKLTEASVMGMWVHITEHVRLVGECLDAISEGLSYGLNLQMPNPVTQAALNALWDLVYAAAELANQP